MGGAARRGAGCCTSVLAVGRDSPTGARLLAVAHHTPVSARVPLHHCTEARARRHHRAPDTTPSLYHFTDTDDTGLEI